MDDELPDLAHSEVMTRTQATAQQLDAAVGHFFAREYAACITLAGAAERVLADVLTSRERKSSFSFLKDMRQKLFGPIDERTFGKTLNASYNGLHHADDDPLVKCEITSFEALQWLARGIASFRMTALEDFTTTMERFHVYYTENEK